MDKKKIFILILLFVLKFNLSFGAEITIDLKREKINLFSKDPEINGKVLNLSDLDQPLRRGGIPRQSAFRVAHPPGQHLLCIF